MSGHDKPTLPGFRDVFGDPTDPRRRQSPAPPYTQQQNPSTRGAAPPGARGYPATADPAYLARQQQWASRGPPPTGRSPYPYYTAGAAPMPAAAASHTQGPGPAGGHFSILRTGHGQTQLSTASASSTYSGLSGTVRPLRHTEFSQYAIATQTSGGVDVRYQCPHCEKGFDRPSSLKTHINSHTGEKPYTCLYPRCGRQFGVLSNMYRHMRTAHEQFITAQGSAHPHDEGDDDDEDAE